MFITTRSVSECRENRKNRKTLIVRNALMKPSFEICVASMANIKKYGNMAKISTAFIGDFIKDALFGALINRRTSSSPKKRFIENSANERGLPIIDVELSSRMRGIVVMQAINTEVTMVAIDSTANIRAGTDEFGCSRKSCRSSRYVLSITSTLLGSCLA